MKPEGQAPIEVLLVDDDEVFRRTLARALARRGVVVHAAGSGPVALELASKHPPQVALLDLRMPGMDGLTLMKHLRAADPALPVVLLTGHGSIASAIEAIRLGAFDYLEKPCDAEDVANTLQLAARPGIAGSCDPIESLQGTSPALQELRTTVRRVADSRSPVLILGESGTGKNMVARVLHDASSRASRPFVTLDAANPHTERLEAEVFGVHTSAETLTPGLLHHADGGTLFIDQLSELAPDLQTALLRVVESGAFRPLGATQDQHVKVRFVAASGKDLVAEAAAGRFRKDLLWRLDVFRLVLPPLRERRGDIPAIVQAWLGASAEAQARQITFTADGMSLLAAAAWPGNVRELLHTVERAVLLTPGGAVDAATLRSSLGLQPQRWINTEDVPHGETLDETERRHIVVMLEREGGNVSRVSELLGIDRRTLQRKMKRYGLR
jgi:DNA-binding NtrC family response regulator